MSNPGSRFSIGYALAEKKQHSFIQDSLVSLCKERGLDLVKIDRHRPLVDQGPFDCLVHKLYGDDWNRELKQFHVMNPNVVILDSPEAIERLHNRISMLQVVSELQIGNHGDASFGIPKQIVIYHKETLLDRHTWEFLRFPIIAKPLVANGTDTCHKMALVFNPNGLNRLNPPIVLQEFVNHGGVIFKVYVVGEYVKCVKRKSLPDVSEEKLKSLELERSLSFSQVSNVAATHDNKLMELDDTEMPPQDLISDIAKGLGQVMKLKLFNFDVIRDSRIGNRYLIIDINYFPGYAKMPDYETVMADFFLNVARKNKNGFDQLRCDSSKGKAEEEEEAEEEDT